jgi:hypothetical protein
MVALSPDRSRDRHTKSTLPALPAEEHVCAVCALAYSEITVEQAVEALSSLPEAVRAAIADTSPE